LYPTLIRDKTARDLGKIRVHQLDNLLEVVLATAKIGFADLILSFSSCSTSHLTPRGEVSKSPPSTYMRYQYLQQRRPDEFSAHTSVVEDHPPGRN
jgi:hypothetical protein